MLSTFMLIIIMSVPITWIQFCCCMLTVEIYYLVSIMCRVQQSRYREVASVHSHRDRSSLHVLVCMPCHYFTYFHASLYTKNWNNTKERLRLVPVYGCTNVTMHSVQSLMNTIQRNNYINYNFCINYFGMYSTIRTT